MRKIINYLLFICISHSGFGQGMNELQTKMDEYIQPIVKTNNFSGTILVSKNGVILFQKEYGLANRAFGVATQANTRFHILSLSKTFTAAAILMLEQEGKLSTTDLLSKYIPDYPYGEKITIHHLLAHTSGITNINDLPIYEQSTMFSHQSLEALISLFKNQPLEFQPGERYQYSNSNYNLLAYIIEKVSGLSYGNFLSQYIFKPLAMTSTLHHDQMSEMIPNEAVGYVTDSLFGIQKAPYFDWSTKTGNGSIISTAPDLLKWMQALSKTALLNDHSKSKMFTLYAESGYGWYIKKLFDRNCVYMNGRAPGFSAYMAMYGEDKVSVVVLSNIYVPVANRIGIDLVGMVFNQPVEPLKLHDSKISQADAKPIKGSYQFGKDFYRPNYVMDVTEKGGYLYTNWGVLIPEKPSQFIQRYYWSKVAFKKDSAGVIQMMFDQYRGTKIQK